MNNQSKFTRRNQHLTYKKIIMTNVTIHFKKLSEKTKTPKQATFSDTWYDLFSVESYELKPGERKLFSTNISAAIPHWYYWRIAPRSWLAYKHWIDVLAWVIDSWYRWDIWIILINFWTQTLQINEWDKIAQFIIESCHEANWDEVEILPESQRWDGSRWSTWK